ncbi:MAG TPA: HlyD family efflux transporter periplasmic adaptor subunit [Kofleriaceae bacterium]|jgi:HlyD family secretion protein|nr:HlyD family efflux transporter periplasmic adaptor subunit [Kofleriaceae bacterium]
MKRRHLLRRITWLALAVAAISAFGWALRPRPIAVETDVVSRGPLTATVIGEGRTQVKDLFVISAPVDGQLQRIALRAGDPVTANPVIARIRPIDPRPLDARSRAEARARVEVARAAVERAEATAQEAGIAVEHADSELARSEKLAQTGAVARAELEHAGHESGIRHHAQQAAHAAIREARAELVRATAAIAPATTPGDAPVTITSPISGQVLRVLRESAGPVAAGTPLLEVGDITCLEIRADLLSSDAASVREGAAATITSWGGPTPLAARVRRVEPAAFTKISALGLEEQRVHVVLDLVAPPPPGLGHDYRVDLSIVMWSSHDVLRVPARALFRSGDRWAVFVLRDGRARRILVELGETDGTLTAVTRGLVGGEVVIAQPSDAIADSTRVRSTSS